jgi:hypothetical protein
MATVHVTDKKIGIPESLYKKISLLIKRCVRDKPKSDSLINVEGEEGIGKTTFSAMIGYIVHCETGRPFSEKNMFFDVKKAVEFAKSTNNQIIIFDEPATDLLSAEWWKDTQKNLIRLLMMARKKRHFMIFNLTKFYKFAEYVVVDRARCMIRIYSRGEEPQPRFMYIKRKYLEALYNDYRYKKKRNYVKYAKVSGKIRGTFPDVFDKTKPYNILDTFSLETYEKEKDKAIMSIGSNEVKKKEKKEVHKLKKQIATLECPIKNKTDMAQKMGIALRTLLRWVKIEDDEDDKG